MKKVWEGEIMFDRSDEDDESDEEGVSLGRVVGREGKEKEVRCVEPDRYWNGRRFGTVFRRESKKRMAQDMGLSVWRDAYVAFHRMDAHDVGVGKLLKKIENGDLEFRGGLEEDDDVEEYRSKQLAHSRMVELNAYAGSNMEFRFRREDERRLYRRVSEDWHMVLGLKSRGERLGRQVKKKNGKYGKVRERVRERAKEKSES